MPKMSKKQAITSKNKKSQPTKPKKKKKTKPMTHITIGPAIDGSFNSGQWQHLVSMIRDVWRHNGVTTSWIPNKKVMVALAQVLIDVQHRPPCSTVCQRMDRKQPMQHGVPK